MDVKTIRSTASSLAIALASQGKTVSLFISESIDRNEFLVMVINLIEMGAREVGVIVPKSVASQMGMERDDADKIKTFVSFNLSHVHVSETTEEDDLGDYFVWCFENPKK